MIYRDEEESVVSHTADVTVALGGTANPVPTITSLNPTSSTSGTAFNLDVIGSSFNSNSTIRWNGVNQATTLVSPTQVSCVIGACPSLYNRVARSHSRRREKTHIIYCWQGNIAIYRSTDWQ